MGLLETVSVYGVLWETEPNLKSKKIFFQIGEIGKNWKSLEITAPQSLHPRRAAVPLAARGHRATGACMPVLNTARLRRGKIWSDIGSYFCAGGRTASA